MKIDINEKINAIITSADDPDRQLLNLNELFAYLNPVDSANDILKVCDAAINISLQLQKSDMLAQLYLIKAKTGLFEMGLWTYEMKNLVMALNWFQFALESRKQKYLELDKKINTALQITQKYIDNGFYYLKQKPYIATSAYCYNTSGEIYGQLYLQYKLYYFRPGRYWNSHVGDLKILRFLNIDNYFLLDKSSIIHIRQLRGDCIKCFKEAIKCYKKERIATGLANSYMDFAMVYHSFDCPFRKQFYLLVAKKIIKKNQLNNLWSKYKSIKELPFIGDSGRGNKILN